MADLAWFKGFQFFDTDGNPLNGGLIHVYDATTTSVRTVYKNASQATPWAQPITLDSAGRLTDPIYVPTGLWKFIRTAADGSDSIAEDNIPGAVTIPSAVFSQPQLPVLTKAADYSITTGDLGKKINVDTSGGDVIITLNSAITDGDGAYLEIQNVGASGVVTINAFGAQTINGESSITLLAKNDSVALVGDGANWSGDVSAELRDVPTKTANYTATYADFGKTIKVNATGGARTVALPIAILDIAGFDLEVVKVDSSGNTVTVDGAGTDTINGALTYVLSNQYDSIRIKTDGANWFIISVTPPDASTSVKGLIEIATINEAAARTNTTKAISPFNNPLVPGFLYGLTLSNGTDATNDIDIALGLCRDLADTYNMLLTAGITKRLDASWAVGDGNGGLDTGSIGNNTYHVYLIRRSDTGVVDALFSLSASAPTMPTNYDSKRRIGSFIRTGGSIVAFIQQDDEFLLSIPVNNVNTANPGTAAIQSTLTVPAGVKFTALFSFSVNETDAGASQVYALVTSPDQANTAPTATLFDVSALNYLSSTRLAVRTSTSSQIRYRLSASAATTTALVTTHGWIDRRGRLA